MALFSCPIMLSIAANQPNQRSASPLHRIPNKRVKKFGKEAEFVSFEDSHRVQVGQAARQADFQLDDENNPSGGDRRRYQLEARSPGQKSD